MKNLKMRGKLTLAFTIMVVLVLAMGVFGYLGMHRINQADNYMYDANVVAVDLLGHMRASFEKQRLLLRNYLLFEADSEAFKSSEAEMAILISDFKGYLEVFPSTIDNDMAKAEFDILFDLYTFTFEPLCHDVLSAVKKGDMESALLTINNGLDMAETISTSMSKWGNENIREAEKTLADNISLFSQYSLVLMLLMGVSVVVAISIGFLLNRMISLPLRDMVTAADTIAEGDLHVNVETQSKDEVGQLAEAFRNMASGIQAQADQLAVISDGDLSAKVQLLSDRDVLGQAMESMASNLNQVVRNIITVAEQVSLGAKQVSDDSHVLAQGSSEQATAIEQLSSSIYEISLNTKENAKMAASASELATTMRTSAQDGTKLMSDMMRAVEEIGNASAGISKINRLIDDISFQTNILSINAAVEAANAGQHGKGFAVVAGEVRKLAAKSAQAANDADQLIENSLEKAKLGASIAAKTFQALTGIVDSIMQVARLMDDIAKSSAEQSMGVEQINIGIEQVAQVVHLNSETAERSAMAATEMATQAQNMEHLVSSFRLRGDAPEAKAKAAPASPKVPAAPQISLDFNRGKY